MKIFGRYLDSNNLRSLEFLCNHLGGERRAKKKQWVKSAFYHHLQPQARVTEHSLLNSKMESREIFISGTLLWAAGVPPKLLIQLPHWLNCSVNRKSKIFLYPTNALQGCSGKFVMHTAAAVPY